MFILFFLPFLNDEAHPHFYCWEFWFILVNQFVSMNQLKKHSRSNVFPEFPAHQFHVLQYVFIRTHIIDRVKWGLLFQQHDLKHIPIINDRVKNHLQSQSNSFNHHFVIFSLI